MKVNSLIVAAFVGALVVLPAHGFGSWNNATYASRFRPAQENQPTPVFQIAAVATLPAQTAPAQVAAGVQTADSSHPWGPPKPCVSHGH